jgi:Ca-activated chloride channel family protein
MRLSPLISLSLLLLSWQTACAQLAPADDFFNSGAQFYISNNIAQAKESVASGLKFYPGDTKLKKLDELLKQQSQQQSQQNQQSQSQQNSEQNQKQQQQPQQNQPAQNQSGQQNDKQQQEQPQQEKSAGKQSDEKRDGQTGQSQALKAQEMSPEQAQRLLDAQKGDEQFLQLKPKNSTESPNKPIKDW